MWDMFYLINCFLSFQGFMMRTSKRKPGKYYSVKLHKTTKFTQSIKQRKWDYLERIAKINEENDFGS